MAEMFPPECREHTLSKAERKFFDRIRQETGGDWYCLHSVGLTGHRRKPWTETDFVLIGPGGIYCLEVKGGRVSRSGGRWAFTNAANETNYKDEGPFEQVESAASALHKHLTKNVPELQFVRVGCGVVMPDIVFNITGPDIRSRALYDERDRDRPVSAYLRRLVDYWHEEIERTTGHPVVTLTDRQRRVALDAIRADFDLRPSLRTRTGAIADEMLSLTSEQYRVLDGLRENPRTVVRGCAGSGKTLLALEEARRRAVTGARVLLCCRTPELAAHLSKMAADLPTLHCRDLRTFMMEKITAAGFATRLPAAEEADLFNVFLPEVCEDALLELDSVQAYDFLVVDEAQDLLGRAFCKLFDAVLASALNEGKWMMFLDPYQDLFQAIAPGGWERLLKVHPAQFRLSVNCRNTKNIAVATQMLSGVNWDETLHLFGPEVEQKFCRNDADVRREVSRCIGRWLSDGISPAQIVVLSTRRWRESVLAGGLLDLPLEVTDTPRPGKDSITYRLVDSFKGLESDFVIVVDVNDVETPEARIAVYVACTRARVGLGIFLNEITRDRYMAHAAEYGAAVVGGRA